MTTILPKNIPGLTVVENWITDQEAQNLVKHIDNSTWSTSLKRRTQQYGYALDYTKKQITKEDYLGEFPTWLREISDQIQKDTGVIPNQVIINEYLPGQFIHPHVDATSCFGEIISSLSLLAPCTMRMENLAKSHYCEITLPPTSRFTIQGPARHNWRHGTLPQNNTRRVSITFRTTIPTK